MTKLKNTKKGMAKKALSISLVAAMLATSNVPVWAAEDLFSDGSVAVEAEIVNDADMFTAEDAQAIDVAPVAEEDTGAPVLAAATSDAYAAEVNLTGLNADGSVTWGNPIKGTVKVSPKAGTTVPTDIDLKFFWKVGDYGVSDAPILTPGQAYKLNGYTPKAEDCGKSISIYAYAENKKTGEIAWEYTSDAIKINAIKVSDAVETTTPTNPTYNNADQKLGFNALFTLKAGSKATAADFELAYSGDLKNVTDEGIAVTLTPKTTGYEGQLSALYKIAPMTLDDITNNVADYITANLVNSKYVYTGNNVKLKKADVKLTDKDTKVDLSAYLYEDNDGYVSGVLNKGADGTYTVVLNLIEGQATTGSKNYTITKNNQANRTVTSSDKLSVTARDLSTVNVTIKPQEFDGNVITSTDIAKADVTFTDKTTGETLNLFDDVKLTLPADAGKNTGTYSVTIEPKTANVIGNKITADLKVVTLDMSLAGFIGAGDTYAKQSETYTGEQIKKDITKLGSVSIGGKVIPPSEYDITFGTNVNAGTNAGKIYIVGKNSYAGSQAEISFNINAATISAATLTANQYVEEMDTQEPSDYKTAMGLVVKAQNGNGKEFALTEGTDYTVTYAWARDNANKIVGVTATVTAKAGSNYTGTATKTSTITKAIIRDANIRLKQDTYTYTGKPVEPVFDVVVNGRVINPAYYKTEVVNNVNTGTATLTVYGDGTHYSADVKAKATFTITAADASKLTGVIPAQSYTGYSILPVASDVSLTLDGVQIDTYSNFDLSYGENVNIGEGTVTLTPKSGNKNFTGTKTVTFQIAAEVLKDGNSSLKYYSANGLEVTKKKDTLFSYDGTEHKFDKVVFAYGDTKKKLTEGTDYEIKYVDNVYGKTVSNEQRGAVLVIAKGTYGGGYTGNGAEKGIYTDAAGNKIENVIYADTFKITQQDVAKSNIAITNGTYAGGLPVEPTVSITVNGKSLVKDTDFTLQYSGNENRVDVTSSKELHVTVVPKNGYTGTGLEFNWGIDKFDLANADVTIQDGKLVVKCGKVDIETSEYTTTTNDDGTITITAVKTSKNYTGSKTVNSNGQTDAEKPAAPVITDVQVKGNKATVILAGESDGATGYDYVISKDRNCITNKDYDKVNKNILTTKTTFTYTQQGTYYAYCHSWKRVNGKKVFSGWSNAYPFVVTSITPDQPVVTSVKVSGKTVKVTYTKAANATGYDLVLGSKTKKVNGEMRPVEYGKLVEKVYKGNTVTATFTNVPKGTYYAGLHAYNRTSENNGKVFSPWSNTKKVTVK